MSTPAPTASPKVPSYVLPMGRTVRKGDTLLYWVSGTDDGISEVLEVLPYRGRYPNIFNCVLRLSAQRTMKGWVETAFVDECAKQKGLVLVCLRDGWVWCDRAEVRIGN
jgi:hypothetical protein